MKHTHISPNSKARQSGATLIIALLTLVVILITGLAVMSTSSSQFKLAANSQYENMALNQAEIAVATAEDWLSKNENGASDGFSNYTTTTAYLHPIGHLDLATEATNPLTMNWNDANSIAVNADSSQRYLIELVSKNNRFLGTNQNTGGRQTSVCNGVNIYRITARGESNRRAVKLVQSVYSVLSC
jgi:Tfp pilus assembly protein PilX